VATEEFRQGLIRETEAAIKEVERDPAAYAGDEKAKLENLLACIRAGHTGGWKGGGSPGSPR
jgi:hypothetical protein